MEERTVQDHLNGFTSDHTWISLTETFESKVGGKSTQTTLNGMTWNVLKKCHERNNPWKLTESDTAYSRRKEEQLREILSFPLEEGGDFIFLQEADWAYANSDDPIRQHYEHEFAKKNWGIITAPAVDPKTQRIKQSIILYNKKTLELHNNENVLPAMVHGKQEFTGLAAQFTHRKTRQPVRLTNIHLEYRHDYSQELLNHLIQHQKGGAHLVGGDYNPEHDKPFPVHFSPAHIPTSINLNREKKYVAKPCDGFLLVHGQNAEWIKQNQGGYQAIKVFELDKEKNNVRAITLTFQVETTTSQTVDRTNHPLYINDSDTASYKTAINDAIQELGFKLEYGAGPASGMILLFNEKNHCQIALDPNGAIALRIYDKNRPSDENIINAVRAMVRTAYILNIEQKYHFNFVNSNQFHDIPAQEKARIESTEIKINRPAPKVFAHIEPPKGTPGIRAGSVSPIDPSRNYHIFMETHTEALNTKLQPSGFSLDLTDHSLVKNGHKTYIRKDGTCNSDLLLSADKDLVTKLVDSFLARIALEFSFNEHTGKPFTDPLNFFITGKGLTDAEMKQFPGTRTQVLEAFSVALENAKYSAVRNKITFDEKPIPRPSKKPKPAAATATTPPPPPAERPKDSSSVPSRDDFSSTASGNNNNNQPQTAIEGYESLIETLNSDETTLIAQELNEIIEGKHRFFKYANPSSSSAGGFSVKPEIAMTDTSHKLQLALNRAVRTITHSTKIKNANILTIEGDKILRDAIRSHLPKRWPSRR